MTDPSNRNIQLVWRSGNEVLDVRLRGHMTASDGQALLDSLCDVPRPGPVDVVLDLSGVIGIDGAAAKAILDAYLNTSLRRGTLKLVGLPASVCESLRKAGVFNIVGTEPAAGRRRLRLVHGNQVLAGSIRESIS